MQGFFVVGFGVVMVVVFGLGVVVVVVVGLVVVVVVVVGFGVVVVVVVVVAVHSTIQSGILGIRNGLRYHLIDVHVARSAACL